MQLFHLVGQTRLVPIVLSGRIRYVPSCSHHVCETVLVMIMVIGMVTWLGRHNWFLLCCLTAPGAFPHAVLVFVGHVSSS